MYNYKTTKKYEQCNREPISNTVKDIRTATNNDYNRFSILLCFI